MSVGSSPLSASTQCDVVLSQVSIIPHVAAVNQLCGTVASRSLVSAGSLAQLSHCATAQLHSDGQPTQPTSCTDGSRQEPDVIR